MTERRHRRLKGASQQRSDSDISVNPQRIEAEQQPPVRSWITDAIIISLTTLIAYLWALYYEVGFFEYFSLPYYLISLNPSIVLATNAVLVIVFGGVFAVVYIVINRLPEIWYRIVIGVLFIVALFFCRVCRIEGRNEAKRQEKFLIVKQNLGVPGVDTEVAVLRVYGEYLFAVPINRADKKFEKKLVILKMSDMPKTPLNLEKIGPLEEKP